MSPNINFLKDTSVPRLLESECLKYTVEPPNKNTLGASILSAIERGSWLHFVWPLNAVYRTWSSSGFLWTCSVTCSMRWTCDLESDEGGDDPSGKWGLDLLDSTAYFRWKNSCELVVRHKDVQFMLLNWTTRIIFLRILLS